jgi:hypothetical protein
MTVLRSTIIILLLSAVSPTLYSQKIIISGRISDLVTKEAISGAHISVTDSEIPEVISDTEGRFTLVIDASVLPAFPYSLCLQAEGYMEKAIEVTHTEYDLHEIFLKPENQTWRAGKFFRWESFDGKPELLIKAAKEANLNMLSVMDRYFTKGDEKNVKLIDLAHAKGILVFVIFQTFYNDDAVINESNSAIDQNGNMVKDNWLSFICPNEEGYKIKRLKEIEDLVSTIRPHGISMDFFRYFVYWEAGREGNRPQTCFCHRCLRKFEMQYDVTGNPDVILLEHQEKWTEFKYQNINEFAARIHSSVKAIKPDILMNLHMVPWKQDDYDGAIKSIAAQDIVTLSRYFDFIQPMTYSTMLNESLEWIYNTGADASHHITDTYVIPCIQADDASPENIKMVNRQPLHGYSIWPFEKYCECHF